MSAFQKRTAAALRDQLTLMGQRRLPSNTDGFDDEFDSLRALDYQVRSNRDEFYTASLGSNMSKNRFRDVLPNEGTRVILDPINQRGDGDYINANYIDARRLFGVPFVYIATQAPLRSTIGDFWRMVYENNTTFIVMLCAEIEAGKQKSERYWPDTVGEVMALGPLNVVLVNENHRADTIFRTIALRTLEGKERRVHHLQYTRWPDQGIPDNSAGLMEIVLALGKSPLSTQTPIVVHCSGGVGRTGVFLTLHIALALFELEQPVSIPRIVQYLKYCRSGMVQRKDQYLFCYYAVLREMEKMVWSVEAVKHVDQKMIPIPENVAAGRRPIEFLPQHPAQTRPELERSALQPFSVPGVAPRSSHRGAAPSDGSGGRSPEHGIRAIVDFGASAGSGHGSRAAGLGATGRSAALDPDDVEGHLEQLRHLNQAKRRTVSVFAPPAGSRGAGGGRLNEPKIMPLHARTPLTGLGVSTRISTDERAANSHFGLGGGGGVAAAAAAAPDASPQNASRIPQFGYGREAPSPAAMPSPIESRAYGFVAGGAATAAPHAADDDRFESVSARLTQPQPQPRRVATADDYNNDMGPALAGPSSGGVGAGGGSSTTQQSSSRYNVSNTTVGFSPLASATNDRGQSRDRVAAGGDAGESDLGSAANDFNSNFLRATRRNDFGML